MRLCADENIPEACVALLRSAGHDVLWIKEASSGMPDEAVLQRALDEHRLLITLDKDFGELVFRKGANASHGVVLFRIPQASPKLVAEQITNVLGSREDWAGNFSVVDERAVRMRALPTD